MDIFDGLEPIPNYARDESNWPRAWKLPDQDDHECDLFDKTAHLSDDVALRGAVHVWDNCLRAPGVFDGVQAGLISAHARFLVGSGRANPDLEKAADALRDAWLGMARQAQKLMAGDLQ